MKTRYYILFILIFTFSSQAFSCRFTVREIGFSTLSRDNYTLVYLSENLKQNNLYPDFKNRLIDSNISFLLLDPEKDKTHPAVLAAKAAGLKTSAVILLAPDGRILSFESTDLDAIINKITNSPIIEKLLNNFHDRFAYTILIEGKNSEKNRKALGMLEQACNNISNRMPNMPKQVKNGPSLISISQDLFDEERILLWAIGIEEVPEDPLAFVIYGRGRIIGDILTYDEIMDNRVFQYLAMIGADCECGLDRKWMLGNQIPMDWPKEIRQKLTDELGFDVDNPMILAEMSFILSKDPIEGAGSDLSFAPNELNLDDLYQADKNEPGVIEVQKKRAPGPLLIILLISGLILITGMIIFLRRIKNS